MYADDAGEIRGLSVDMLTLLQRRLGLELRTLPARPLHAQLEALKRGEADLISSLRPTPERAAFLLFTAPYARVPAILVVRRDAAARTLDALKGQAVAVGRGYAVEGHVRTRWPAVQWQAVDDDAQALTGLGEGRFGGAVTDAASYAFLVERQHLAGLQPADEVGFEYDLSFAVRRDWPALRDRLDAGIRALGAAERRAVLDRWLTPLDSGSRVPRAAWATRIGLGLLATALLLAAVIWRRRVGRPSGSTAAPAPPPVVDSGRPAP